MENDTLFWHGDQVWPERIALLRGETHLRRLILWGGGLTSDRLQGLGKVTQIEALAIGECPVDDALFEEVVLLRALKFLNLSQTNVCAGFARIAELPVAELVLEGCQRVTDEALPGIAEIAALSRLVLRGASTTPEGIAEFSRVRPRCEVIR